jgi:hypothetical protein
VISFVVERLVPTFSADHIDSGKSFRGLLLVVDRALDMCLNGIVAKKSESTVWIYNHLFLLDGVFIMPHLYYSGGPRGGPEKTLVRAHACIVFRMNNGFILTSQLPMASVQ